MQTDSVTGEPVLIVDLDDMSCFEAVVLDVDGQGCRVVSDRAEWVRSQIGLRLPGFDKLICGEVVAHDGPEARIAFGAKSEEPTERRREIRRPVWITASVCCDETQSAVKCRIVDASRSGCRLESERLDRLADVIQISIPGLDLPLNGRIVWRSKAQAGVQLTWPIEPDALPSGLETGRSSPRASARRSGKRRISAFGQ